MSFDVYIRRACVDMYIYSCFSMIVIYIISAALSSCYVLTVQIDIYYICSLDELLCADRADDLVTLHSQLILCVCVCVCV